MPNSAYSETNNRKVSGRGQGYQNLISLECLDLNTAQNG